MLVYDNRPRVIHRHNITATLGSLDVVGAAEMDPRPSCEPVERRWSRVWLHGIEEGVALKGSMLSINAARIITHLPVCVSFNERHLPVRLVNGHHDAVQISPPKLDVVAGSIRWQKTCERCL